MRGSSGPWAARRTDVEAGITRMTDRRTIARSLLAPWTNLIFWDDVEYEVETLEVDDFEEFEAAGELPFEPRAEFKSELQEKLRLLISVCFPVAPDDE